MAGVVVVELGVVVADVAVESAAADLDSGVVGGVIVIVDDEIESTSSDAASRELELCALLVPERVVASFSYDLRGSDELCLQSSFTVSDVELGSLVDVT